MGYRMEELVPLVAELTEKYTGFESTSITYEKAEQLMGAVLYCIREAERGHGEALTPTEGLPARRAYEMGYELVKKKVRHTLRLYHEIMSDVSCYDVGCLRDILEKGMPEFFKWYDARFAPQNEILTLDYPVLNDLSDYQGVDKVFEFLRCIHMEQHFLHAFPDSWIREVLAGHDALYEDMVENICEVVLTSVSLHIAAGKPLSETLCGEEDVRLMEEAVREGRLGEIQSRFEGVVASITAQCCEQGEEMFQYLSGTMEGIMVRLENNFFNP